MVSPEQIISPLSISLGETPLTAKPTRDGLEDSSTGSSCI